MKKTIVSALVVGALLMPTLRTDAYHVIKQHRNSEPVAQEEQIEEAVVAANEKLTATASARTERSLISEAAPDSVKNDKTVQTTISTQQNAGEYKMRSGDQLQIVVYGHPDLSTQLGVSYTPYVVRPDGNMDMPLIGNVRCQGKTVPQVVAEITKRLAEYIIDPQVTINVTKLGTTRVYVLGEARQQGLYELEKSHTLLDAVAKAGGFTQKSTKRKVYVVRQGLNNFVTKVNVLDILKHGAKNNIELQEGDCVYISSNHKMGLSTILSAIYSITNSWDNVDDIRDR